MKKVVIVLPEYLGKHHHPRRRHHRHHIRVWLAVGDVAVQLIPNGGIHMSYTLDVGKTENLAIEFLDQNDQPMVATPKPDSPAAWSQLDPSIQALIAAADGNTATATGLAAGSDTIQLTVIVGGQTFVATMDAVVNAAVPTQTLTSVGIIATPA